MDSNRAKKCILYYCIDTLKCPSNNCRYKYSKKLDLKNNLITTMNIYVL